MHFRVTQSMEILSFDADNALWKEWAGRPASIAPMATAAASGSTSPWPSQLHSSKQPDSTDLSRAGREAMPGPVAARKQPRHFEQKTVRGLKGENHCQSQWSSSRPPNTA